MILLQRSDWIQAGVEALAQGGVDAIRVEVLAKRLGVSKGSFYWHFRDRADLLEAVVDEWERVTTSIIQAVEVTGGSPVERLQELFHTVTESSLSFHRAVKALHAWAARDPVIAARVAKVEQLRIAYMTRLFERCGFGPAGAKWRAEVAYLIYLGWMDQAGRATEESMPPSPFDERLTTMLLRAPSLPSQE